MQRRQLGSSDLWVSSLCLGTMTWGEQNTEQEAHQQLDYAIGQGIDFIDTAEMYPVPPKAETQGLTERYLGTWLKKRGLRDQLVIATKVTGPGDWMAHIRQGPWHWRLLRSSLLLLRISLARQPWSSCKKTFVRRIQCCLQNC